MRLTVLIALLALGAAAPAAAVPSADPEQIAEHQAIAAAMDQAMADFLQPGPKVEGWDKGGLDVVQLVEALPGGAKENYLVEIDRDGEPSVTIIGAAADMEKILPADWTAKLHAGSSKAPAAGDDVTIAPLGSFFVAGWEGRRRVGDGYCSGASIGGHLYQSSKAAAKSDIPPNVVPALFHAATSWLEKTKICWRLDREGDGFRTRHFLEDGRSLPNMDKMSGLTRIVRARPLDELLAMPAK